MGANHARRAGQTPHVDRIMLSYVEFEAGADVPEHSHPHEQACRILEGELEFVIDGEKKLCQPGDMLIVPGGVPHSVPARRTGRGAGHLPRAPRGLRRDAEHVHGGRRGLSGLTLLGRPSPCWRALPSSVSIASAPAPKSRRLSTAAPGVGSARRCHLRRQPCSCCVRPARIVLSQRWLLVIGKSRPRLTCVGFSRIRLQLPRPARSQVRIQSNPGFRPWKNCQAKDLGALQNKHRSRDNRQCADRDEDHPDHATQAASPFLAPPADQVRRKLKSARITNDASTSGPRTPLMPLLHQPDVRQWRLPTVRILLGGILIGNGWHDDYIVTLHPIRGCRHLFLGR